MELQVSGLIPESYVDGPGIRFTIFVQGCDRRCPGCHNPRTMPHVGGSFYSPEEIISMITKNPLVNGVTFSGGEPFLQARALCELGIILKEKGYHIITFSGYTFDELLAGANQENGWLDLLNVCDWLVDGPFLLAERSLQLYLRGSRNQRILDLKRSLDERTPVAVDDPRVHVNDGRFKFERCL